MNTVPVQEIELPLSGSNNRRYERNWYSLTSAILQDCAEVYGVKLAKEGLPLHY
jgi:hypothetical protein